MLQSTNAVNILTLMTRQTLGIRYMAEKRRLFQLFMVGMDEVLKGVSDRLMSEVSLIFHPSYSPYFFFFTAMTKI